MASKAWRFYCEVCNWNKVTKTIEDNGLVEHKRTSVQKGLPRLVGGKVENPEVTNQIKKYKCPKCGRLVSARQITDVQHIQDEKIKLEELKKQQEKEKVEAESLDRILEKSFTSPEVYPKLTLEKPKPKESLDAALEKFLTPPAPTKGEDEKSNIT